jgi:hypothetical protein
MSLATETESRWPNSSGSRAAHRRAAAAFASPSLSYARSSSGSVSHGPFARHSEEKISSAGELRGVKLTTSKRSRRWEKLPPDFSRSSTPEPPGPPGMEKTVPILRPVPFAASLATGRLIFLPPGSSQFTGT